MGGGLARDTENNRVTQITFCERVECSGSIKSIEKTRPEERALLCNRSRRQVKDIISDERQLTTKMKKNKNKKKKTI